MHWKRELEVLTPLFNRGAYQTPEIRVPSIRGMVRWWFRVLGGSRDEEKTVFGGMQRFGETEQMRRVVASSALVFRISNIQARIANPDPPTLPHKQGRQSSQKDAFMPGAKFTIEVFSRFGDLAPELKTKAINALEVWTMLGALGLRANRGGGNVWPCDGSEPTTTAELRSRLKVHGCGCPIMLADSQVGLTVDQLRAAATDTVLGHDRVFGFARGRDRLASPLKFKIVRLDNQLRLIIFGPRLELLEEARHLLIRHKSQPESWRHI